MKTHPNEVFRRQRGHIETLQGQVKNLQATNLNLLFKVVFGSTPQPVPKSWQHGPTKLARRVHKEQA
ncbi:hypothetical protein UFOVP60_31 [uncultured Caudovirales phage]|uniref:Uncharacterized protein n=1 Tax=uncultured Caudovirales phage TaxID=2100421 RepID=A0A6J5T9Z3_9CAUD|nr:hypothetical protein UFOVP60_31 [uncultured Caudovirales phage]